MARQSFTRLRLCCAPVHVRARRGRAGAAAAKQRTTIAQRADAALRRRARSTRPPTTPTARSTPTSSAAIQTLHGRAQGRARGRAGHRRGHRRARAAARRRACIPLFLTLQRNAEWWSTQPLLAGGQRVTFEGSELVWQYVPGQGLQLHPLANFGKLNAYAKGSKRNNARNTRAARRADGDGGAARRRARVGVLLHVRRRPAAVGQRARAGHRACRRSRAPPSKLGRMPELLPRIQQGLELFEQAPPTGVRVPAPDGQGVHYAQYSFWPSLRILNGFVQSLVGLYDVAQTDRRPARRAAVRRRASCAARARGPGVRHRRLVALLARRDHARVRPAATTRCCATS